MKRIFAALLVVAGLSAFGCTKENHPPTPDATSGTAAPAAAASPGAAVGSDPNAVVATLNGQPITEKELDEDIKPQLQQLAQKYQKDQFDARKSGLDDFITKKLVDAAAKKENLTEEAYLKKHVEEAVPEATEADAQKFFDANKARMGTRTFDQIKTSLIGYLTSQNRQAAASKLFDSLRAGAKIDVKLEEPVTQVAAVGPSMGPKDAPVTIVEFSDFQCPFCSRVEPTLKRVMADYAGKVRFVFRDYPLPFHEHAEKAAEASHCAEAQGKYWPMHDAMFSNQDKLDEAGLKGLAKDTGLDVAKFTTCLDSGSMKDAVAANRKAGSEAGVSGTPHFFVNGHSINGAQPYEAFKTAIDHELAKVAQK